MHDGTNGEPLRICTTCEVRHYLNCAECYGFGVRDVGDHGPAVPVNGDESRQHHRRIVIRTDTLPCPLCGSTINGVPAVTA